MQNKVLIQLNNAGFKYPTQEYVFEDIKLTVKQHDKIAIVGANGAGKSTLLKILSGDLKVTEGEQIINCKPYYVPQVDLSTQQQDLTIYDYIAAKYEEWWDILTDLEKIFGVTLDTQLQAKTLSGGELMKLNLCIALRHKPDVLLLDEPTNHLDVRSINSLIEFVNDTANKITYVIVSHDVFFLDKVVNTIWELDNATVTAYGGNYTFYKEQKELHLRGVKKQYNIAKDKLKKAQELEQKEIENQAKKANTAKRAFIKGSIDKRAFSQGKEAASSLQKGKAIVLDRLVVETEEKLEEYETEERKLAFMNIKNTSENKDRTIFEVEKGVLKVAGKVLIKDINLKVGYAQRLVIVGDNGSGKTSLVKALAEHGVGGQAAGDNKGSLAATGGGATQNKDPKNIELEGELSFGTGFNWVYIDQHYSLIDPAKNLIQNVMSAHPSITESIAKEQLGKFKFKTDYEHAKLGAHLSGGEMVRLCMAIVTAFAVDIIILDEPTNNLDVETVEVLIKSLNNFRGAVIVISHNIDFLNKINIKTAYMVRGGKFVLLKVGPGDRDGFYRAIL